MLLSPMLGAPIQWAPMGTYNNYGSGCAGSYNYGVHRAAQPPPPSQPQPAQYNNHGTEGAGCYNFGNVAQPTQSQPAKPQPSQPAQYNNHGSEGAGSYNMPVRQKRVAPMVMYENLVYGISGKNVLQILILCHVFIAIAIC